MSARLAFFCLLLSWLTFGADAPRKVAVLVYFPSDPLTAESAKVALERLRAKTCGYEVVEIPLDSNEKVAERIQAKLKDEKIPATAPVFLHGHGMEDGDKEHAFVARKPKLDAATRSLLPRQLVKGKDVIKAVREKMPHNPIWMSSCQSGGVCFGEHGCLGASCRQSEDSYGGEDKIEGTLAEMVSLLCDPKKFKDAAGDAEGVLTPEKLNAHFCTVFGEKKLEEVFALDGPSKITRAEFDQKVAAAKLKNGEANVKTTVGEKSATLEITIKGKACFRNETGKTQSPQVNTFRLYQHTYVPQPGELEGKPRGKAVEPEH